MNKNGFDPILNYPPPRQVSDAFPEGVTGLLVHKSVWYVVHSARDGLWYGVGPQGILKDTSGRRKRWFRTPDNCACAVALEAQDADAAAIEQMANDESETWTQDDVKLATHWAGHAVRQLRDSLQGYDTDRGIIARTGLLECRSCYYLGRGRVVCHAFTDYVCKSCGTTGQHPNSGVPKLCEKCASSRGLCRRCGGEREKPE